MKRLAFIAIFALALGGRAQQADTAAPFAAGEVALASSWIKEREQLNTELLRQLDADRLLHNFRVNAGLPSSAQPLGGWEAPWIGLRGHFTGHYLSALASVVAKSGDAELRAKLDYMVDELAKCQAALGGGYLSAFASGDFDTLESTGGGVWAPYYTYHKIMQGLIDAAVKCGNSTALRMAAEMADYACERTSRLTPQAIERMLYTVAANPANEAGGMNDALYQLYAQTGDERHLRLAQIFERDWFLLPLAQGRDILSGLHSNTHLPLILGFARAYDQTHEPKYRDAVVNFWEMLMTAHAYANGSSSGPRPNVTTPTSLTAEHWGTPRVLSNTLTREIAESCVSHNTQRLTAHLFRWTADARYADAYMNCYYNAQLALQNRHTGQVVYHLPLGSPRQKRWLNSGEDFRCCNGTNIEAFATLEQGIYYHRDRQQLWVNLYVPSTLNWEGLAIEQSGDLLRTGCATLTVGTTEGKKREKGEREINLLIPSWSTQATVKVNGESVATPAPGSFCRVSRRWAAGDQITLQLGFGFRAQPMPDDSTMVALFYGPMMLAFCSDAEVQLRSSVTQAVAALRCTDAEALTFSLYDKGDSYTLRPLFELADEPYSVYVRTERP